MGVKKIVDGALFRVALLGLGVLAFTTLDLWAGRAAAQAQPLEQAQIIFKTDHATKIAYTVELARSAGELQRGLMFRKDMPQDHGMLFVFPKPQFASFWMKNTFIPLDIIFIRGDGRVSSIAHHAVPHDLTMLKSTEAVRFVVELNAGQAKKQGIDAGDHVELPPQAMVTR